MGLKNSLAGLKKAMEENAVAGSKDYFVLSDDGDEAKVIFLHGGEDSHFDYGTVYQEKLPIRGENKTVQKYINVVDKDTDPLAKAGSKPRVRALFQLVEIDDDGEYSDPKIWDRGPQHIDQIITFLEEYGPLNTYPIKIKREGKKGDRNTKYHMLPLPNKTEMVRPEDLPEVTNLLEQGKYILQLTQEEMQQVVDGEYYLEPFDKKEDEEKPTIGQKVNNAFNKNKSNQAPKEEPKEQSGKSSSAGAGTPPPPILAPDGKSWLIAEYNENSGEWEYPNKEEKKSNVF